MALVEDHPEDTVILGNAASFLTLSDKAMSEELLKRAQVVGAGRPGMVAAARRSVPAGNDLQDAASRRTWSAKAQAEFERSRAVS